MMPITTILRRLFGLWLVTTFVIMIWLSANIVLVLTPLAVDVSVGVILIFCLALGLRSIDRFSFPTSIPRILSALILITAVWISFNWVKQSYEIEDPTNAQLIDQIYIILEIINNQVAKMHSIHHAGYNIPWQYWWNLTLMAFIMSAGILVLGIITRMLGTSSIDLWKSLMQSSDVKHFTIINKPDLLFRIGPLKVNINLSSVSKISIPAIALKWGRSLSNLVLPENYPAFNYSPFKQLLTAGGFGFGLVGSIAILNIVSAPNQEWLNPLLLSVNFLILLLLTHKFIHLVIRLPYHRLFSWIYVGLFTIAVVTLLGRIFSLGWTDNAAGTLLHAFPNFVSHLATVPLNELMAVDTSSTLILSSFARLVGVWMGLSEILLLLAMAVNVLLHPVQRSILPYLMAFPSMQPTSRRSIIWGMGFLGSSGILFLLTVFFLLSSENYVHPLSISENALPAIYKPVLGDLDVKAILPARMDRMNSDVQVLFAGTNKGLFRSTDAGSTWHSLDFRDNQPVRALSRDEQKGTIFVGSAQGIDISQDNGDHWQHVSQSEVDVLDLAFDTVLGVLYIGASDGVYRSRRALEGTLLETMALPKSLRTWTLEIDNSHSLFAGTDAGIFHYQEETGWAKLPGPPEGQDNITHMAFSPDENELFIFGNGGFGKLERIDERWRYQTLTYQIQPFEQISGLVMTSENILYVGTEKGIYSLDTLHNQWELVDTGGDNSAAQVFSLVFDSASHTILAGQTQGIVCLHPNYRGEFDTSWYSLYLRSSIPLSVRSLKFDRVSGWIYAIPDESLNPLRLDASYNTSGNAKLLSIYRIHPEKDVNWQPLGREIPGKVLYDFLIDDKNQSQYAWTDSGLFVYNLESGDWKHLALGLMNSSINTLIQLKTDSLLLGTERGLFRSSNQGQSWQTSGLEGENVQSLVVGRSGAIIAIAAEKIYRSTDQGRNWQFVQDIPTLQKPSWLNYSLLRDSCGKLVSTGFSDLSWASCEGDVLGGIFSLGFQLPQSYAIQSKSGACIIYTNQSGSIAAIPVEDELCHESEPLNVLASSLRVSLLPKLAIPFPELWGGMNWMIPIGVFIWIFNTRSRYLLYTREFGIPFWLVGLLFHPRLDVYAQPERIYAHWPSWEKAIQEGLLNEGEVAPVNLHQIPVIFRNYAIKRYFHIHSETQSLEIQAGTIRYPNARVLREWRMQTILAGQEVIRQKRMSTKARRITERLVNMIASLMDFNVNQHRDGEYIRAYQVEAPSLRLKLPLRFPLIFVAAPEPSNQTVKMLVDTVDILKDQGYFALIVPLAPPETSRTTASKLISAIRQSGYAHDFIVLSYEDLLDILISKSRAAGLIDKVVTQVDLTMVSPFIVNGPVPPTMFFGRDHEIKTLLKKVISSDFAIVGNRKVGKTSLLKQVESRLLESGNARPLLINCQDVRSPRSFYRKFQKKTGKNLVSLTLEDFSDALSNFAEEGSLPVLLIDEIDALLAYEASHDSTLLAQWRTLSQQGMCHFIFCGGREVIRQLNNLLSPFYNFSELMLLDYLDIDTANQVLTQPLQTMGVEIEEPDRLLSENFMMTAGHPNLIQYIGKELVESANRRGERRILVDDLHVLNKSPEFTNNYLNTIWGAVDPLEKIITLVAPIEPFRLVDIHKILEQRKVVINDEKLSLALRMLTIYSILQRNEKQYQFRIKTFPEILHRTQEVESLLRAETLRLKRHNEKESSM